MSREAIFAEIAAERDYQDNKWGTDKDDTLNEPNDWVAFIAHHSTRWFTGGFAPYKSSAVNTFRKQMIKVAAIALAAIESLDRQRATKSQAFYEDKA